jgi:anti-sigma factor RsiW
VTRVLTCRELVELVTDYLDGALPPARHAEVVAHLADCADCLRYLAQLQTTRELVAGQQSPGLSADDRAAAVAAFQDWCGAVHVAAAPRRRTRWWSRVSHHDRQAEDGLDAR